MDKSNFEGSATQAAKIKSLKLPSHNKEISILHSPINDTAEMHISRFTRARVYGGHNHRIPSRSWVYKQT